MVGTTEAEMLLLSREPRLVKTSFALRPSSDERLRAMAAKMKVPMSAIIDRALDVYLTAMEDVTEETA